MSAPPSIIDPFHRALFAVLAPSIDDRMISLAEGSAKNFEEYKYQTGMIQAFNEVLAKCREIEVEMYGARPGAEPDQQQGNQ